MTDLYHKKFFVFAGKKATQDEIDAVASGTLNNTSSNDDALTLGSVVVCPFLNETSCNGTSLCKVTDNGCEVNPPTSFNEDVYNTRLCNSFTKDACPITVTPVMTAMGMPEAMCVLKNDKCTHKSAA